MLDVGRSSAVRSANVEKAGADQRAEGCRAQLDRASTKSIAAMRS
jgi:hypothetical protein